MIDAALASAYQRSHLRIGCITLTTTDFDRRDCILMMSTLQLSIIQMKQYVVPDIAE